jgi:thioredoxin reductase
VAAQTPWVTGKTFVASGHWATTTEPGHKEIPVIAYGGSVVASAMSGYLSKLAQNITLLNPNNAYTAGAVSQAKLRAVRMSGAAIAETGIAPIARIYDYDGTLLL